MRPTMPCPAALSRRRVGAGHGHPQVRSPPSQRSKQFSCSAVARGRNQADEGAFDPRTVLGWNKR